MHLILGFAGKARAGKDTLFQILSQELFDIHLRRISIGDYIRNDLNSLPIPNLYSLSSEEKEIWRPLMVAYGVSQRNTTKGRYFIEIAEANINSTKHLCNIHCITDIRFDEYEKDEVYWLKNEMKGKLIYIDRYTTDLQGNESSIPFINDVEKTQDPKLREKADYILKWPTTNDRQLLLEHVQPLITKIRQDWMSL